MIFKVINKEKRMRFFEEHNRRLRLKFMWYPCRLGGTFKWLEWAWVMERYDSYDKCWDISAWAEDIRDYEIYFYDPKSRCYHLNYSGFKKSYYATELY